MKTKSWGVRLGLLALLVLAMVVGAVASGPTIYLPLMTTMWKLPVGMVAVPEGPFLMGCDESNRTDTCGGDDELPLHVVDLDGYSIDKAEVTNKQYAQCVDSGFCSPPASASSQSRSVYYSNPAYGDYPVVHVDWHQASIYCAWKGKRLPSEAEWEKAARGSQDSRRYPWGDGTATCTLANFYDYYGIGGACEGDTSKVGSHPDGASVYGILDMAGNVREWVADWYDEGYYAISPYENPSGPAVGEIRVIRGGTFLYWRKHIRVPYRHGQLTAYSYHDLGFRCAN